MKDYALRKKNKKWSVAKAVVVGAPAVSEVQDSDGVVVREARAEQSHETIQLSKKTYDAETGKAGADSVQEVTVAMCDDRIAMCDKSIAGSTSQKEGWETLKTDISAL